ncbi:MAG: DUF3488 domain-containing protein [Deltaproteobacteria bacterium]|nr:DUF3488 domain-containing protein [Deltaproteobacteria bacterium]
MNFERTFLATSYALVGVAFVAVASSGQIGLVAPAAFVVAYVASLLWKRSAEPQPGAARFWTGALIASFFGLVVWSIQDDNWLLHALEFALLMTTSRLFQRRYAKDWLQLYALSFLLILVAAVIHPTLVFAIAFLIYAVLAIWALVMLHIVRNIEIATRTRPEDLEPEAPTVRWRDRLPWRRAAAAAAAAKAAAEIPLPDGPIPPETLGWRRRRLVGGGFLLGSSLMALAALGASMLFFFLFPRIGMGFFFARTRGAQSVTGFADEVQLGGFGLIKTSAEVVMRVRYPDEPERLNRPIRIRGLSFDRFDGRGWSRTEEPTWMLQALGQRHEVPGTGEAEDDQLEWRARIYLEPLDTEQHVIFHPPGTRLIEFIDSQYDSIRGRRKRVDIGISRDMTTKVGKDVALTYVATVVEPRSESARRARVAAARGRVPDWVADRWTQLPERLDPRIPALAGKLAVGASPLDKVLAVEAALRRDWTYSLAGDQDNNAPLEDFLFGIRHGHCEYFATAMAVLLRTQGIPARVVNGFMGGERNDFGDYVMIKQADAHAWVEVFFPKAGWLTFDPTPPAGQLAPVVDNAAAALRRLADGAALLWYTWVVEYDLERQVEVFRKIGRTLRRLGGGLELPKSRGARRVDRQPDEPEQPDAADGGERELPLGAWLALLAAVVAGLLWWWRRRSEQVEPFDRALQAEIAGLERELDGLGVARARWQTLRPLADAATALDPELGRLVRHAAEAWDRARWGAPEDDVARAAALTSVRAARAAAKAARLQRPRRSDRMTPDGSTTPDPGDGDHKEAA